LLTAIEVGSAFVIVGAGMAMVAWGAVLGKRMLRLSQNVEIYDTSDARAFGPLQDEADTSDQP
jgi:hypothetical protein